MSSLWRESMDIPTPRSEVRAGRCSGIGLVAVLAAGAGPDEGVAVAVLIVEEVGVDRRVEARVVQLDREVVAALVGALRPGGPDLGAADIDPMAGGVVVGPVGLRDDADVLGLDAQGDDLALELAAGLLEGTDVGHVTSPWLFRARDHRGLDGDLQAGGDRRRTRFRAGAQRRMVAGRVSCLARNAGSAGRGRKSHRRRCVSGDRGAAVLRPDQAIERPCGPGVEQHPQEKTWPTSRAAHKWSGVPGEEMETLALRKDGFRTPPPR